MQRISQATIDHYLTLRLDGTDQAAARKLAGLGHVRADYAEYQLKCLLGVAGYEPVPATPDGIVAARAAGRSWGNIAACAGVPEGRARKLHAEATGRTTKGQRVGKGGRFVKGAEALYATPKGKAGGFKYNKDGSLPKR